MGNYFNDKNEVQTNVGDIFSKLRTFSDSIEKVLVKDKKFGFIEESLVETKADKSKTDNAHMTRAEIT